MTEPAGYPRRRDVRKGTAAPASSAPPTLVPGPSLIPRPSRGPDDLALLATPEDSRGRHATGRGDGFGRLVAWTIAGAAIPGSGLIAAGRRIGWLVLVPVLFAVGALGAVAVTGRGMSLARRLAFNSSLLLDAVIGIGVLALLWSVVVIVTHAALRRERLRRGQQILALLLVTVLVAAVALPAAVASRYVLAERSLLLGVFGGAEGSSAPTSGAKAWAGIPRVNVLLVGADSSQGHIGTRPDTVMVASIDTSSGDTVLFGLPRQLLDVRFPTGSPAASAWTKACTANGEGGCQLNAVYLFGIQHPSLFPGASDPGLAATRAAASGITGLDITYEAMINLDGFENLVNAMGGITLSIPAKIAIGGGQVLGKNGQPTGRNYPVTGYVPAGKDLHLNGYQAEWYVRSRWPLTTTNNERMARQRCFVNAAVRQYGVLDLAKAFPSLAATAQENLKTNISAREIDAFITLGQRVKGGSLRSLSFDSENISTAHPDYPTIHAMVQSALDPVAASTPAPSSSAPSTGKSPAPAPAATADPGAAVDADSVCPA